MSQRAAQLGTAAATQVGELINLVSAADDTMLHRPCPGREKLGDGSIGAIAAHTADNYERIGTFVAASQRMASRHGRQQLGRHKFPGALRVVGHTKRDQSAHQPIGHGQHDVYTAETARSAEIAQRLTSARDDLARIGELTDDQLDAIPPKGSFRFCDGERTLELVLAGLLKHQQQQVQAVKAALA
jgi:hypothetical protein